MLATGNSAAFPRRQPAALAFSPASPGSYRLQINSLAQSHALQQIRQATINQVRRGCRKSKTALTKKVASPSLDRCPQKKGVVVRVMTLKPKKPNSAQRKTARVKLSNGKFVYAYIPGEGHNVRW